MKGVYYIGDKLVNWIAELQSIAQAGLTYGKDVYDRERYQRIREITAEMMAAKTGLSLEKVTDLFCGETGYQTPKVDTRAAIFKDNKIILVHESDGTWSLPGGWVEFNLSIKENTIKEIREETGLEATAEKIIAIHDRNKHNVPEYVYGVCKIFVLCRVHGGEFVKNIETTGFEYFAEDEIPTLALAKNNEEQVKMCFRAYNDPNWEVEFD